MVRDGMSVTRVQAHGMGNGIKQVTIQEIAYCRSFVHITLGRF